MLPQTHQRKKANSSKVNLTISFIFHALLVGALLYFAARSGILGKQLQKLSVTVVKEKPPEKPKEPEKPKVEPPKVEPPKMEPPKVAEARPAPPVAAPVAAPPVAEVAGFEFDGGKAVNSERDPVQLYKGYLEYELRSKWSKPDNMQDDNYVADVQVSVDKNGHLGGIVWEKGSGNAQWDQSVRNVFKVVQSIDRRPPTNFPPQVTVRFDVEQETEPLMTQ